MENNFQVLIRCMTYNHSAYIADAMNGFVMQQTDFPFVCTIVDDASTDGEQEVIKKYMQDCFELDNTSVAYEKDEDYGHVTFARHKVNKNCYFAVVFLKENHYSQKKTKTPYLTEWMDTKYVAICEGDDYWTDPLKLQRQVSFLETHEDFSICFHEAKVYDQSKGDYVDDVVRKVSSETDIYELAKGNFIHTMTVVYKNNPLVREERKKLGRVVTSDYALHMLNAKYGKIKKLPECMAVYRLNQESVWGTKDALCQIPIWNEMLIRLIPFFDDEVQQVLHKQYMEGCNNLVRLGGNEVRKTKAYRLGRLLLKPFSWIKSNNR